MNNDQRLIPFLGGLVIGGAAGSQTNRIPYYNNYPVYYAPYPYYYGNYPVQYPQQTSMNSPYYAYNEYQPNNEINTPIQYQERSIDDLSYVPIYIQK